MSISKPKKTRNLKAPTPATDPKTHHRAHSATGTPAGDPVLVLEFDAAAHRREIAQVAYRIWLERADRPGSPERDWIKAEIEVRAKYAEKEINPKSACIRSILDCARMTA
jgi:Protein of unknown function (DUF2934)